MSWLFAPATLTFLLGGLGVTLGLAALSIAISLGFGIALALARLASNRVLRIVATIYIEGVRALPVLLIIYFCYLALPEIIGIRLSSFAAGTLAMSAFTAALIAEIVRAGILAVPAGIREAAAASGLRGGQTMRLIILPIALRQMMPALIAQFVTLLKDTSYTAVIGVLELTARGKIVFSQPPFDPVPVFALIALVYFVVNFGLGSIGRRLEVRA
jgi:putative glutamine transport system permease protein